ncbi:hypothetical protein JTE90_018804 [Oedothorax gibbosus]|uniref:Uncharacterized protein n=1 Tax=Oedothorax gibbosus TaxID=931172 RepID=A0AAV6TQL9_9ARAC|nr:hypothetical protein JTE90_018804 [Oedothorax gibbosus]
MAVRRVMHELFPDNLSNGVFEISRVQDWDPKVSLDEWLELEPKAFVTYIPPGDKRVFFISVPENEAHFTRLLTSAFFPDTLLPDPVIGFDKVSARLLKDPSNARRKSSVRTIYRCGQNLFIVCKWFTFGLLHVEEGEKHVYMSNASIKVFHMSSSASVPGMRPPNLQERAFCPRDFSYFTEYVMRPSTTYTVPAMTRYLIVTVKKCYFTVDRLASDVLVEGSIPFDSHRTDEDPINTIPVLSPRSPRPEDDRLQSSAAKRTRRRSPERDLPACSSWSSPREMNQPQDTVTGATEEERYQEWMQELTSCDFLSSDFPLETCVPFATTPGGSSEAYVIPFDPTEMISPQASSDITPQASSDITPQASSDITPQASSDITPQASSDITPQASSDITPQASPGITPQASPGITPQASPGITPQASPDITPQAYSPITPQASADPPRHVTDPPRHVTDTSSRCIVTHLPAPRLWRRTQPGTVAQAHITVFQHRTYLWEDDDAPGMGPTLRAAMSSEAPVLALDLSHMDVPMDFSRPQ